MGIPSFRRVVSFPASSHEDRLTEILALTLDSEPRLARLFAGDLSKNALGQRWDIRTQERIDCGSQRRVDLALESTSTSHLIWIEVKLDSLEHEEQLDDYYKGLKEKEGPCRKTLVFLTREGGSARRIEDLQKQYDPHSKGPVEFSAYDWQKLSNLMSKFTADTGLKDTSLCEKLKDYLQSEGAVMMPIEDDAISGLVAYRKSRDSLIHLLKTISENVRGSDASLEPYEWYPKPRSKWDQYPFWFRSFELEGAEHAVEAKLILEWQLQVWEDGDNVPAGPTFIWGLTLVEDDFGRAAPDLLSQMTEREPGFIHFRDGRCDRIVRSMALSEVVGKGSVEQQAQFVSQQISRDFEVARHAVREWMARLELTADDDSLL